MLEQVITAYLAAKSRERRRELRRRSLASKKAWRTRKRRSALV